MNNKGWRHYGSQFLLNISMLACGVLFFSAFFLSLTVLQAAQTVHIMALVSRRDARSLNDLIEVTPFGDVVEDGALKTQLEEMMVRFYLNMRYSIIADTTEMARRWGVGGLVHRLSSESIYNRFRPSSDTFTDIVQKNITQSVDVREVSKRQEGLYVTEFDVYTVTSGRVIKKTYSASLRYRYVAGYKSFGRDFSNPFGMVFTGFDTAEKKQR